MDQGKIHTLVKTRFRGFVKRGEKGGGGSEFQLTDHQSKRVGQRPSSIELPMELYTRNDHEQQTDGPAKLVSNPVAQLMPSEERQQA